MALIRPAIRRDSVSCKCGGGRPQAFRPGLTLCRHRNGSKYSRAFRRGDDKFHLACCQMKHLHTVCLQRMFFSNGAALAPPAPIGCAAFPRAARRANVEPSRWRLKVSPTRNRGWGATTVDVSARSPAEWRGGFGGGSHTNHLLSSLNHKIRRSAQKNRLATCAVRRASAGCQSIFGLLPLRLARVLIRSRGAVQTSTTSRGMKRYR